MAKLKSINPANGEVNGEVKISISTEITSKVAAARKAYATWREVGLKDRLKFIKSIRNEVAKNKSEIAKLTTMEMGKPVSEARPSVESNLRAIDWLLDNSERILKPETTISSPSEIHQIFYEPLGVVAAIAPWNFPSGNMFIPVLTNLIVGNTVVFKHSELCPLTGEYLAKIFTKILPKGVFNLVNGDGKVGEELANQDVDLIYFTGSQPVGHKLYETAAKKFIRAFLELGGSAPGVVFADADLGQLTKSIFDQRFHNNGQVCTSLKRLIVEKSIADDLIDRLSKMLSAKKIGDPLKKETDFGPLASEKQVGRAKVQLEDALSKGAKIVAKLELPENLKGAFFAPVILKNIRKNMKVWTEEVFAPILPMVTFNSEKEALELANETPFGLGGYVYSSDKKKAERVARQIVTGNVSINGPEYYRHQNPFGGAKISGIGRQNGSLGLHNLCNIKVIAHKR